MQPMFGENGGPRGVGWGISPEARQTNVKTARNPTALFWQLFSAAFPPCCHQLCARSSIMAVCLADRLPCGGRRLTFGKNRGASRGGWRILPPLSQSAAYFLENLVETGTGRAAAERCAQPLKKNGGPAPVK